MSDAPTFKNPQPDEEYLVTTLHEVPGEVHDGDKDQSPFAAALELATAGRPVFPCHPSKRPLTKRGHKDATTDPAAINAWWTRWPNALVGMPTGSGLVVVDVDPRSGGAVDSTWPVTATVETRSGGWHLYYLSAEPLRCSAGRVAPGVDIRADGGYVIVPPSPGWRWVDPEAEIAEMPDSIREAAQRPRDATGRGTGFQPRERVEHGERNDYLCRCAGFLLHAGFDEGEALDLLRQENAGVCRPPVSDDEVRRVLSSISRYHR